MAFESIASAAFIIGLFAGTIRMATPILFASLGEVFAERSGVLNLGLEGVMLVGSSVGFAAAFLSGNVWVGMLVGFLSGAVFGLFIAFIAVSLRVDQVVTGVAVWITGMGLSSYLFATFFGKLTSYPKIVGLQPLNIPVLSQIPVIGEIIFQQNVLVYLAFILVPVFWFILFKTTPGLKIRAVGENPKAADTLGIGVHRTRYLCVIFGAGLAGLAGTFLSVAYLQTYTDNMVAGRGFMAIAIVILGRWNPVRVMFGALLFGGVDALQIRLQALSSVEGIFVPTQFLVMLPYIVTVVVLVLVSRRAAAPGALTLPYQREN